MLEKALIVALICMAIHVIISWDGMIFNWFYKWAEKIKMPVWIKKPLFDCPICLVPWWGTPIYWIFLGNSVPEWIIVIFTAMGINSVIVWAMRR